MSEARERSRSPRRQAGTPQRPPQTTTTNHEVERLLKAAARAYGAGKSGTEIEIEEQQKFFQEAARHWQLALNRLWRAPVEQGVRIRRNIAMAQMRMAVLAAEKEKLEGRDFHLQQMFTQITDQQNVLVKKGSIGMNLLEKCC